MESNFKHTTIYLRKADRIAYFNNGDKYQIELLIDAFNRFSWRACFFIWSIMTIMNTDYNLWNKVFFEKFYNAGIKGCSEKVVACFI